MTRTSALEKMKDQLPVKLAQRGSKINDSKIEKYTTKKTNFDNYRRDCKQNTVQPITQNDIKKRKVLAINALNKLKHLFLNNDLTIIEKT